MVSFPRAAVDHVCGRWVKILGENRFHPIIFADIRLCTCDTPLTGCIQCRNKFFIERYAFQGGLWTIFLDVGCKYWVKTWFHPVILAGIRLCTCDTCLTGCIQCRIKFCIERYAFQGGLWTIFLDVGCKYWVKTWFHPVILADFRLLTCEGALSVRDGCRIKFCIEWCTFTDRLCGIFV
jgi:hypothetical protein